MSERKMEEKQPILSICIPTYNRAEILRDTLTHYVSCSELDDGVEIIISDNASPDHTQEVCKEFVEKYKNIHYFRNEQNVRDRNFIIVQNYAKGRYIKLMNDNIYMPNEAIGKMKEYILDNAASQVPLFFVTGPVYQRMKAKEYTCHNLNEYVQTVSLFVTAISCFGTWQRDWEQINGKDEYSQLLLSQVDWTYQIIAQKWTCKLIYLEPYWLLSKGAERKFSENYNFFQVHLTNYNIIKQIYVEKGLISEKTMRKDGHEFLRHYRKEIFKIIFLHKKNKFDTQGTFSILNKYYCKDPYYWWFLLTMPLWYLGDIIRRIWNKLRKLR